MIIKEKIIRAREQESLIGSTRMNDHPLTIWKWVENGMIVHGIGVVPKLVVIAKANGDATSLQSAILPLGKVSMVKAASSRKGTTSIRRTRKSFSKKPSPNLAKNLKEDMKVNDSCGSRIYMNGWRMYYKWISSAYVYWGNSCYYALFYSQVWSWRWS